MLIGGHVSTAGGLERAIERAEERGCETMQIFNQSPRTWRPTRYSEADFAAFRERFAASPMKSVYIHAVYLINVASDDAEVCRKSLASLTHALSVGDAIGADGVIVHPGSGKGQAPGPTFKKLGRAMRAALAETELTPLLFENTAGAGFTIGRTFEELARVIDVSGGEERIGVCLDSCHLLASGYEVRERAAFKAVVDEYDRVVGLDRLQALHLNDSQVPLASNVDRHANLGAGELGEDGIRVFLGERRFKGLPVLVEVPGPDGHGPDREQIDIAKRLRPGAAGAAATPALDRAPRPGRAGRTRG
ncbi:MAG: deoxyribonuclease IV, partial [Solirubrobacterales bacterium]